MSAPKVIELPRVPTPAEIAVREVRLDRLAQKVIDRWDAYFAERREREER